MGRAKTPVSEPLWMALLNCTVKAASVTVERLLLAWTYFLIPWRLLQSLAWGTTRCTMHPTRAVDGWQRGDELTDLLPLRSLSCWPRDVSVQIRERREVRW